MNAERKSGAMSLLLSRRLGPLCLTQTCGAFNDNLVKNAMVVLAIFKLGAGGAGLAALAGALFIAPYALLSATAGQLADRFDKSRLIQVTKAAEVLLMCAAAYAFMASSVPGLLAVLFGAWRAGDDVRAAEIRHPAGSSARRRTDRRQRPDRGLHVPGDPGRHGRGRRRWCCWTPARRRGGARGVGVALLGLGAAFGIPPAPAADRRCAIGWNIAARDGRGDPQAPRASGRSGCRSSG